MKRSTFLRFVAAITVSTAVFSAGVASAQDYPTRPIRVVVPFPPGGGTDVLARLIGQRISDNWGQQMVIENRPGAAGLVGASMVASSPADGYTLLITALGGINEKNIGEFQPVVNISTPPSVLVAHPDVPAKTMKEFLALIRSNPGKLNFGSSGMGSLSHLSAELLKSMAKLDVVHVPYKGMGQVVSELLGNQVQFAVAPLAAVHSHIQSGKLRPLAVTSAARFPAAPDVPTIAESGVAGYEAVNWFGMLAPAGVDRRIIDKLNAEVNRVLQLPDVKARLSQIGADPVGGSAKDFERYIRADTQKWAKVIRDAGIVMNY